jgi:CRISPR/Cas system-associated protein endoribonuclease Cas2
MFWKDKRAMQNEIEELKNEVLVTWIRAEEDMLKQCKEFQDRYTEKYLRLSWEYRVAVVDKSKLLTENEQLKAQISVLSKIQLKEDEYKEEINRLDKENSCYKLWLELSEKEFSKLEWEIKELKAERKELINKIYECNTKDAVIVKPELPVVLSTKK